jgi:hypothetical protein
MKVVHRYDNSIYGSSEEPSFILTNRKGELLFLPAGKATTKFQGAYFNEGNELSKIINNIRLIQEADEVRNNFSNFERAYHGAVERFHMTELGVVYDVENYWGFSQLSLDMRKIYDFSDQGRIYKTYAEKDSLIIEYTKFKDATLKKKDYSLFLVIKGIKTYEKADLWRKESYSYDISRRSNPPELYVYDALRLGVDGNSRIYFAWHNTKKEALKKAKRLQQEANKLISQKAEEAKKATSISFDDSLINFSYLCSRNALLSLNVNVNKVKGIYAGLPWFFQFWVRDEAICLPAMIKEGHDVKDIIFRHLSNIGREGMMHNQFPKSDLKSADSLGWLCHSISLTLDNFSAKEKEMIREKISVAVKALLKYSTINDLAISKAKETWMDTDYGNDAREGARIEIQALRIIIYGLMEKLSSNELDKSFYRNLAYQLCQKVRADFYKNGVLADGFGDFTVRPNCFIAYHVFPGMLQKEEWEKVFDSAIEHLWCDFGGFSTISFDSRLYCPEYTGEDNKSYHRGDSWFYLNHLAAISMLRLDREKYKQQITKILEASAKEILFLGAISFNAELTSANRLKSEGCMAQAWSSATFIELCHELNSYH